MNAKSPQGFYLDPETIRALDERAKEEGVSRSDLIVEYIVRRIASGPPKPARGTPGDAGIQMQIYLDGQAALNLSDRAAFEGLSVAGLIVQCCLEGLALPSTGGEAARKAGERLVAFCRSRIDEFLRRARYARERAIEEIDKFRKACPHARVIETSECLVDDIWHPGEGQGSRPGAKMCEDCGLGESPHPMLDHFRDRVLDGSVARIVDPKEFKRLYMEHPYRSVP